LSYQTNLFPPESDWTPVETLPEFAGADAIVIDTETNDPGLEEHGPGWAVRNGYLVGVAISLVFGENTHSFYLPFQHDGGGNLSKSWVLNYVKDICKQEEIPKIFHNAGYDIGWLSTENIEVKGKLYDTQFAAALLDENRYSYSLDNLAKDWCGMGKDETLLREACAVFGMGKAVKANLWRLHAKYVGPYGEGDVDNTYALWKHTKPRLEAEGLQELFELEVGLIHGLIKTRRIGIRVDEDRAALAGQELKVKRKETLVEIYRKFNVHVDVWANASIAKAFDVQGLEYPRTPKGSPSFVKEFLEGHVHELPRMIRRVRQIEKTVNTFIKGMIEKQAVNGRIHCELHSMKSDKGGTVGGRFSCSNPNLQQTSARDLEFGPMVRALFLPEQGCLWYAHDYSSQEPRLTVHYAVLTDQPGAKEAEADYNNNPKTDYHQMVADLCGIARKPAKIINLGLAYGMGELKLCQDLGLPTEQVENSKGEEYEVAGAEGKALFALYHEKVPFIKGLTNRCSNLASSRGYIRTILGRRCRFDMWESVKYGRSKPPVRGKEVAEKRFGTRVRRAMTHKGMNRLIQGSAADQTKKAMLAIYKEGLVPMLQMHDELDFSSDCEKDMDMVKEIMETCVPLRVPVVVDTDIGRDWAEATYGTGA